MLNMQRSLQEPWKFFCEIPVPGSVIDENGHVNNLAYIKWMLEAALGHSREAGATAAMEDAGGSWVVRSHHIEYLKPLFKGETVLISTWVENVGAVKSLRKYLFTETKTGSIAARGETEWVFIDAETGKPMRIPESVIERFPLREDF